jgi:putative phosphoribosyl transferase
MRRTGSKCIAGYEAFEQTGKQDKQLASDHRLDQQPTRKETVTMLTMQKELIRIRTDSVQLEGMLELPPDPIGIVLFAHGSGSSRLSPRNNYVAGELRKAKLGTLLMDFLTLQEDQNYQMRFDISLLTQRLGKAIDWLCQYGSTKSLPIGLFGASTGAAAALQIAALHGSGIAAVVSRGGRPDMVERDTLEKVQAPTLLIVGSLDDVVIELNQMAYSTLHCEKRFEIVPGATHIFEEPGKLEAVAALAKDWLLQHLARTNGN